MPLLFWVKKSSDTAKKHQVLDVSDVFCSGKASFCKRPSSALVILCTSMQVEPISKEGVGIYTASDSASLIYTEKSVLLKYPHYLGVKWVNVFSHL